MDVNNKWEDVRSVLVCYSGYSGALSLMFKDMIDVIDSNAYDSLEWRNRHRDKYLMLCYFRDCLK